MKPEQQRIAIAEFCGWRIETLDHSTFVYAPGKKEGKGYRISDTRHPKIIALLPNYCNDLNAMHEAEKVLTAEQWIEWEKIAAAMSLPRGSTPLTVWIAKMASAQRAEAFLKTVGKLEESE